MENLGDGKPVWKTSGGLEGGMKGADGNSSEIHESRHPSSSGGTSEELDCTVTLPSVSSPHLTCSQDTICWRLTVTVLQCSRVPHWCYHCLDGSHQYPNHLFVCSICWCCAYSRYSSEILEYIVPSLEILGFIVPNWAKNGLEICQFGNPAKLPIS